MAVRPRPRRLAGHDRAGTGRLVAFLLLAALVIRSLVVAPFSIPSESMVPQLLVGDYLLVEKWPYGWSRHSFPLSLAPFSGRIGGVAPRRGDVVVFKTPADGRTDYVKRLIGLPGDRIRMAGGRIVLNGRPVPTLRVADFLTPPDQDRVCPGVARETLRPERGPGGAVCRYRRYRETLPGGRSYDVLDLGRSVGDAMAEVVVPPGRFFLMGDNRDRSADSRFPAEAGGGIGMVPAENLVGRAARLFFSVDATGRWLRPRAWPTAIRWHRIGARV